MKKDIYLTNGRSLLEHNFAMWNLPHFSFRDPTEEGEAYKDPEEWIYLASVEFDCPEFTREFLTPSAVMEVDREIQQTLAEAGRRVMELQQEKAKLLCIEGPTGEGTAATRDNSGAEDSPF